MSSAPEANDTSPLEPKQLSDDELVTIFQIESRFEEARSADIAEMPKGAALYLKTAQTRYPRVLLLDGGRGTGKTSLLLTLVKRWHSSIINNGDEVKRLAEQYAVRIENLTGVTGETIKSKLALSGEKPVPDNVRVLAMLDFDPLPPGMPLLAAIVQAWRPLAEAYDRRLLSQDEGYEDEGPLMDAWHRLFQMAAAGWGTVSHHKNLIEQVLDREEQVANWQRLGEDWSSFVSEVIKKGRKINGEDKLSEHPVFVIMIDDCDLQVGRIRQLLPALRMLYHPKVFFLVAADRRHMAEMLQLDFYGQQSDLAHHQNAKPDSLRELIDVDRWAVELADSSVNKVFPLKNRWKLRRLALHELLNFPKHNPVKLMKILDEWPQDSKAEPKWGALGTYLMRMAGAAPDTDEVKVPLTEAAPVLDPVELPPIISYRTAHQIFEQASAQKEPRERALEAIRHLLGRDDSENLVRITKRRKQVVEKKISKRSKQAVEKMEPGPIIEYYATGNLSAFFHEGFREQTGEDSSIVLSARPDFAYSTGSSTTLLSAAGSTRKQDEITSAVIAASLRDDGYSVIATGLGWDIRLALAWTEERVFVDNMSLALAFQWPVHVHPSPLRLLMWSRAWREFVNFLQEDPANLRENSAALRERIAYAWIYYQLIWLRGLRNSTPPAGLPDPLDQRFPESIGGDLWKTLLSQKPGPEGEQKNWTRRMQRLAIPELGIPVKVQESLLENVSGDDLEWLQEQRRRYITDAIIAVADQANGRKVEAENEDLVSRIIEKFERRHKNQHKSPSPWSEKVDKRSAASQEKSEEA